MARWAHLSDIHACLRPRWSELNGKRLLGLWNWRLFRGRRHAMARLAAAVAALAADPPDFVLHTGDAAQLGLEEEFGVCRRALAPLTGRGVPVLCVNGNHDRYGETDGGRGWRAFAADLRLDVPVDDLGVARVAGGEVLLMDQARPNGWFAGGGELAPGLAARLAREWRRAASGEGVAPPGWRIAAGHYPPRLPGGATPGRRKGLREAGDLPALLAACGVSAYFCGHRHQPFALELYPGCTQYGGGSVTLGGWAARYRARGGRVIREPAEETP
jgi:3',5'-cyclic AMP phosphodiesterase CpdA